MTRIAHNKRRYDIVQSGIYAPDAELIRYILPGRREALADGGLPQAGNFCTINLMGSVSTWFAVAVGGALGSLARFWLAGWMAALTGPRFPWGTLLINVLGSFVIGLVAGITLAPARVSMHPDARVFLMVGVCGGFTTFSAFSLQTLELLQAGSLASAAGYVLASVLLCIAAVWGGWLIGRP